MRRRLADFGTALRRAFPTWLGQERLLLLAILAVGCAVRVVARQSVPNGFNNDEASLGYDAYSILKFGVDRHGIAYPAFLIGWGSGMNALSAYLAMPFIAWFGLSEASVRAVNLLGGLASLVVFHALVRKSCDRKTALWAVLLLALCPWHVMMSRWALECNLLPSMFLLAFWLLLEGTRRPRFLIVAGAVFGLCLYAYGTAYFAVPAFLLMAACYLLWTRRVRLAALGLAVAAFAAVATPIAAVIWANGDHGHSVQSFRLAGIGIPVMPTVARYKTVSSLFGRHVLARCWDNLNTLWSVVAKQDDGLIWNAFANHGILYPFGMAFALVGLLAVISRPRRWRTFEPRVLFLLWLASAILLAMVQEVNINRINLLWPPLVFFAAVGLRAVAKTRLVAGLLVVVHVALFAAFSYDYFGDYRDRTAGAFYPGYGPAIRAASHAVSGNICATNNPCFSYAFVLFYDRTDPREFARTVVYEAGGGEFQGVRSFGRYTFGIDRCPSDTQAWILDNRDVDRFQSRAARIESFANYSVVVAQSVKN